MDRIWAVCVGAVIIGGILLAVVTKASSAEYVRTFDPFEDGYPYPGRHRRHALATGRRIGSPPSPPGEQQPEGGR